MKTNVLSIIPARGGSKGLPGKNIRPLDGHPLIAYSILASVNSKAVDKTLCTTDSEEIADVARSYGAEVPFLRPDGISGDFSTDIEFTKDRTWKGTDHAASLEAPGMSKLVRNLHQTFEALTFKPTEILGIEEVQRKKLKYVNH